MALPLQDLRGLDAGDAAADHANVHNFGLAELSTLTRRLRTFRQRSVRVFYSL